jgi:uncharacterized protein GlcG (DUF336 family)
MTLRRGLLSLATILGAAAAPVSADGIRTTLSINSETALSIAQQAVKHCHADGYRVTSAVVDPSGVLLALLRADEAGPHTVRAATEKAYTSASSRNPTSGIVKAIQSNPEAAGMAQIPGFLVLGGGVPIKVDDATVGAVGVAGAPGGHLDEACAQKAIDEYLRNRN